MATSTSIRTGKSGYNGANPRRARAVGSFRVVRDRYFDRKNNLIPVTVTHIRAAPPTNDGGGTYDPFADLDIATLRALITGRIDDDYEMNCLFYDGDHWQQGEGWTGPRPDEGDATLSDVLMQIERAFVSKNCVKEVVNRHVNGCVGREPHWWFTTKEIATAPRQPRPLTPMRPPRILDAEGTREDDAEAQEKETPPAQEATARKPPAALPNTRPAAADSNGTGATEDDGEELPPDATEGGATGQLLSDPNTALIVEAESALTAWWDERQLHTLFDKIVTTALLSGYATVRVFVPAGLIEENGFKAKDLQSALKMIYVDAPDPTEAGVATDDYTMRKIGAYFFVEDDGTEMVELVYHTAGSDQPLTIMRTVPASAVSEDDAYPAAGTTQRLDPKTARPVSGGRNAAPGGPVSPGDASEPDADGDNMFADEATLDLGGRLTMYELQVPKMITEQVRALQRAINKALTMGDNNVNLAGFLERTILNGQVPGYIEEQEMANGAKRKIFRREKYEVGGGSVNFIQGVPVFDNNGKTVGMANPSIVYKDPTESRVFDDTASWFYRSLLESVDQVHYLLAGEQYASGESRKQARADFEASLRKTIAGLNEMGRWMLETALALASAMTSQQGRFEALRCTFNGRIDPGPATVEGIRSAIELNAARGLSVRSMMSWSGVDDVDAELRLMQEEDELGLSAQAQQLAQAQAELDANRLAGNLKQEEQNADKPNNFRDGSSAR